jgi:hypothetical protein
MAKFKTLRQREAWLDAGLGKALCSIDTPSPPPVPDPVAVANAQGNANVDAARQTATLNRVNQITPYGSLTWANDRTFDEAGYNAATAAYQQRLAGGGAQTQPTGSGEPAPGGGADAYEAWLLRSGNSNATSGGATNPADLPAPNRDDFYSGGDRWTSTVNLDPRVQALLDSDLATRQGLTNTINSALGRTNEVLGQDIDYGSLPAAGDWQQAYDFARSMFTDLDPQIQGQQGLTTQGQQLLGQQLGRLGQYVSQPLPTANDATRQRVEKALYDRAVAMLNPRFQQQESDLRSILMNRGLTEGSEAWTRELDNLGRARNSAYSDAMWTAIDRGGEEQQRLLGMELGVRNQGIGESRAVADITGGISGRLAELIGQETGQNTAASNIAGQQFSMQNQQRQLALNEQERQRARILNELASLRTGATVPMPEVDTRVSPVGVNPAPIAQSTYNSYQGQMNNYNAQVQQANSILGALASLGVGWMGM